VPAGQGRIGTLTSKCIYVQDLSFSCNYAFLAQSPLRAKRALVAGLIEKLERKLEQHRADLTHIDGVLRLFQPDRDPGEIKPKRTYARRTRYFARNELARASRWMRYGPQMARL
jgi:hypothetical protein